MFCIVADGIYCGAFVDYVQIHATTWWLPCQVRVTRCDSINPYYVCDDVHHIRVIEQHHGPEGAGGGAGGDMGPL